jgi:curved DNA-binding protein CbpA
VNHYQRLKVAHDAPAEVIRAAYRALATRVHPDRQSAATSPDDLQHIEMAALNAAYETLIDPKLRADYDATLAPNAAKFSPWSAPAVETGPGGGFEHSSPAGKIDLDWLSSHKGQAQAAAGAPWRPEPKLVVAGGAAALVVLGLVGAGLWHVFSQRQVDEALTRQYHDQGAAAAEALQANSPEAVAARRAQAEPPVAQAVGRKPSVDELSRMSDEELLQVLPTLDDQAPAGAAPRGAQTAGRTAAAHHPLDGTPLRLRTERDLVDPLSAPPTKATPAR